MSWVLSILGVTVLWLMGKKSKWGPRLGVVTQILWIIYVIQIREWGLMLGVLMYTAVNFKNLIEWEKQ